MKVVKTIYFVRHGESTQHKVHAHAGAPLSVRGRRQAAAVARRVKLLPINVIITSQMPRAVQTAEIIRRVKRRPIEVYDFLHEVRTPSEIRGRRADHPDVRAVVKRMESAHARGRRFSDEEHFGERIRRMKRILKLLTQHRKRNLLVVAHGGVVKYLLAVLMFGNAVTHSDYLRLRIFRQPANTGITVLKRLEDGRWKFSVWNDVAHLEREI